MMGWWELKALGMRFGKIWLEFLVYSWGNALGPSG